MKEQLTEKKEGRLHRVLGVLSGAALALTIVLCLYVVVQVRSQGYANLGGFMMFRVVTGSMEPTIPTGALLVARETDIEQIRQEDIVCFRTQISEIWGNIVTHRVVRVLQAADGSIELETKGDANPVSDIFYVDERNLIGRVIWHSGDENVLAGLLSLITRKEVFLSCIVMPILLLSALILRDSVRGIRKDMQLLLREAERLESGAGAGPEGSQENGAQADPFCGMTQEEYEQMYERIRAELMEELTGVHERKNLEEDHGAEGAGTK